MAKFEHIQIDRQIRNDKQQRTAYAHVLPSINIFRIVNLVYVNIWYEFSSRIHLKPNISYILNSQYSQLSKNSMEIFFINSRLCFEIQKKIFFPNKNRKQFEFIRRFRANCDDVM